MQADGRRERGREEERDMKTLVFPDRLTVITCSFFRSFVASKLTAKTFNDAIIVKTLLKIFGNWRPSSQVFYEKLNKLKVSFYLAK